MKKPENSNDEFANNVFNNMMDLFFKPEIKKRTEQGLLSEEFQLLAAQAIIYPDGRQPIIKLNAEVSAEVKIKKNVNKEVENFWPSTEQIENIKLRDEEFLNCGHVTIILFNNGKASISLL